MITDKSNGKRYVGSAFGDSGIWARWNCYIGTGHGFNDELTKLIGKKGVDYAVKNFRMSLLEYRPMKTDDSAIIEREGFWKEVMLSRGKYGYNKRHVRCSVLRLSEAQRLDLATAMGSL